MSSNHLTEEFEELNLTPRQIELLMWQMVMDIAGGEISVIPEDDTTNRRVMFVRNGEYVQIICDEEIHEAPQNSEIFKVIWTDGYNRESVADSIVAEHLSKQDADALCEKLRSESRWDGDWWNVVPQDKPLWRGMEDLV